jgi:hypothetical protein
MKDNRSWKAKCLGSSPAVLVATYSPVVSTGLLGLGFHVCEMVSSLGWNLKVSKFYSPICLHMSPKGSYV